MSGNDPSKSSATVVVAAADKPASAASIHASAIASTSVVAAPGERFRSVEDFRNWLIQAANAEWGDLFGQPANSYHPIHGTILRGGLIADGIMTTFAAASDLDTSSSTNIQVAGVDEADIVETDGNFIYIISGQDLVIVDATEGQPPKVTSRVRLTERPVGMYLAGDRLAIVSSSGYSDWSGGFGVIGFADIDTALVDSISVVDSIFLDTRWTRPRRPTTTVTILDVTDRAQPTLVQKTQLDGEVISSRTVDGQLQLVLNNDLQLPLPIQKRVVNDEILTPQAPTYRESTSDLVVDWSFDTYVYETQDEYVSRIFNEVLDSLDARIRSLDADGAVISDTPLFDATDIYRPEGFFARQLVTIAKFDLTSNDAGPVAKTSVMTGRDAQVYATPDSIYLFTNSVATSDFNGSFNWRPNTKTNVWMFDTSGRRDAITLAATGQFDGTLLNQFAADERDGYLRVVTTTNSWSGGEQSVLVLEHVGAHLNVVGSATGIAPDERLYSVRFVGDDVFFVTFRRIDPLFAVDLSDPTNPTIMGELHIPGYSEYLQPIDDTHLLAIGRDTTTWWGSVEEPDSLQVSIFDVSNLTDPRLVDRYTFGGGYSTVTPATGGSFLSNGTGDHHAVSYFADEQIFALPVETSSTFTSWWGPEAHTPLFEAGEGGLQLFRIDVNSGFTPLALIEHDSPIERSIRIGSRLLAISDTTLSVHDLANPTVELGRVDLAVVGNVPAIELEMYRAPAQALYANVTRSVENEVNVPNDSQLALTSEAAPAVALPEAGWVSPSLGRSWRTQPASLPTARVSASSRDIDGELLNLLAADSASGSFDVEFVARREFEIDVHEHCSADNTDDQLALLANDVLALAHF